MDSRATLLNKAMVALNGWSVSLRVNREIQKRAIEINRMLAKYSVPGACTGGGGVLIVVMLQEWKYADFMGNRAMMFNDLFIAGSGIEFDKVLKEFLHSPGMRAAPSDGWREKLTAPRAATEPP